MARTGCVEGPFPLVTSEPVAADIDGAASGFWREEMLFEDAFVNPPSILRRLIDSFVEAIREFRENPKTYLTSAFKGDGIGGHRRKMLLRFGLAIGIVVYACFFGAILIVWTLHAKAKASSQDEL